MSHINNPFATPASVVGNAESKYPDLSSEIGSGGTGNYYVSQQQPQQQSQQAQYYQQPMQYQQTGMFQQPGAMQYQPTGMYSQQAGPSYSSSSYQPQQQQQYPSQYGQQQQQWPQSNPMSDLDPYSNLDSLNSTGGGGGSGSSANGSRTLQGSLQKDMHPRAYVNQQKAQLMSWDPYAWKQLLNKLDALREAWESRKALLVEAGRQGGDPTTIERLKRQAEDHVDSIHASKLQLSEVESGWRHSTDAASKARVREAINAGLASLPEYPTPLESSSLGGSFMQRARNDFILSQYNSPSPAQQQQQAQYQQMMQTGMMYPQQQYQNPYGGYNGGMY